MIKPLYFLLFVGAALLGMMACSSKPKEQYPNLTADEFEQLLQDEDIQLLDVRTLAEYTEGHLPHSLNINVLDDHFMADCEQTLDKERPVAVYCKSGRRSRKAASLLVKKGYTVYNLDKGILGWKEAGKPVEE